METKSNESLVAELEASVTTGQRITPFLWFADRAEEAINFYTSVFRDSAIMNIHRLPAEAPGKEGRMLTATFRLKGLEFMILEAGPMFEHTPAISFFVHCKTQEEVDHLWEVLTANGGEKGQCGWLKDRFGVSWQIVPDALGELMGAPDRAKAANVMNAMMKMTKLDIAALRAAYDSQS
jgi:predicted 3-demethylubiquinone-9 3-methyltransferase (glyoxalase superfamily)